MEELDKLLVIINEIAKGNYSNEIMPLTSDKTSEPVRTIAEAMAMMMVKVEAREYKLEMLVEELKDLNEQIKQNTIKTVTAMAVALSKRDEYTEGHTARVSEMACRMAESMGLEEKEIERIRLAGILHDIGKIGFPDLLFAAHGQKNPPEVVKEIIRHPKVGAEILAPLDFLVPVIEYVHSHHERPDGKGYPRRLKNEDLSIGTKILAVADAFDAMTTERPYQKPMSHEKVLEVMEKNRDTKWDGDCIDALAQILKSNTG